MIDECFLHIPGVGPKTSERLKKLGYRNWSECLDKPDELPFSSGKRDLFLDHLRDSMEALEGRDIGYLVETYPGKEHWRILASYFEEATYFDIETTGISWYDNHATVISAFRNGEIYDFVYDDNLDDFLELVDESTMLVSFNGSGFDIPFIEQTFHIPKLDCPHVDLRWISYHMGYTGGLKAIEGKVGISRPEEVLGIDGLDAVDLFYRWQDGDSNAKSRLVKYCRADVISSYILACRLISMSGVELPAPDDEALFCRAMTKR